MTTQPELTFNRTATPEKLRELEDQLWAAGNWTKAKVCASYICFPNGELGKRMVRKLASMSDCILSGQAGYKHIKHATPDERRHAVNWLRSQAMKMSERAARIEAHAS